MYYSIFFTWQAYGRQKNRYVILDIMKVTGSKKDCAYFEGKKNNRITKM